jgi:mannosyl-3-phosphoglycerate phosphatase
VQCVLVIFPAFSGFQAISAKMEAHPSENRLRQTSLILYIAVDGLIPARGNVVPGLDEFAAALDHRGIPAVWLTNRTRHQLDYPRRKLAHFHPFIAEDGCGVFLPEGYFHLRPQTSPSVSGAGATVRLGRFTCLPVAELQPAASEALATLSEETGVQAVPLRSLPPRELAQNLGLPPREAEFARQRDFDELFFFAGASQPDIERFLRAGCSPGIQIRPRGALWSLAVGANICRCVGEISKLYDRALRSHARSIALATAGQEADLFPACDLSILLTEGKSSTAGVVSRRGNPVMKVPLGTPETWELVLATLNVRR